MDKGIYTALSGGIAKSHELELIANNLANTNTTGFKRDSGTFNEYMTELRRQDHPEAIRREVQALTNPENRPQGDKSFVEMDAVYTDFRQGTLQRTGRTLDLALEGGGFLEVLTPSGVRYTRQGSFNVSADGKLVTANGYPLLSRPNKTEVQAAGNMFMMGVQTPTKPKPTPQRDPAPEMRLMRVGQGPIEIDQDAIVRQNGVQIGQLNIEEFHETQWLEKVGNSLFRNVDPRNLKNTPTETRLHQGFLEGSNVNPISEMTRLIQATRAYESQLQAIKTFNDIDGQTVNQIARER